MTRVLALVLLLLVLTASVAAGYKWGGLAESLVIADAHAYMADEGSGTPAPRCYHGARSPVYSGGLWFYCYPTLRPSGYGPGGGWFL